MSSLAAATLRRVPAAALFVSEPHPAMFGNGANENPKKNTAWSNENWLKSRFHFAFAEYSNPSNDQFGVLRVMNDDLVQPARGFGTHPHSNMEICTYIVRGDLTHQDSTTNTPQTIGRGGVQFMSAGTGVRHSEHNRRADADLRFVQMWIVPRRRGLAPKYGQYAPESAAVRLNQFQHLVGDAAANSKAPIAVEQDVNIYVAELQPSKSASLSIAPGRQAYCLFLEGSQTKASLTGAVASEGTVEAVGAAHDGLEVVVPPCESEVRTLTFTNTAAKGDSHVLVVEMAHDASKHGRRDL